MTAPRPRRRWAAVIRAALLGVTGAGATAACDAAPRQADAPPPPLPTVAPGQSYTNRDDGAQVTLTEPLFRVSVGANHTTAYSWRLDPALSRDVSIVDQRYEYGGSTAIGAGGTEVFILRATGASGVFAITNSASEVRPTDQRFTLSWRLHQP